MWMFSPACVMVTMMIMMVSLQIHGYISCIESERKGLLELKAYVDNSKFPYDWPNDTNSDCCRWERVKCDLTSGRVIGLFLTDIDSPPLNLSLLYPFGELQTLNLSNFWCTEWFDDIHGYKSFGRLKNLEILDLSGNGVNNSVLPFFNAASSLTTLILRGNLIAASFPMKELKNLRNLEVLDLSLNMFIGSLPGEGLSDLHRLQALDLSNNEFSGSLRKEGLCQLKNLRALDLSRNQFTGPFPECFESLIQLEVLDISSNQFNGTLPSFMSNLNALEYLSLSDNVFEGFFSFDSIANLSKLKVFRLSSRSSLLHTDIEIPWQPRFQLSIIELQYCNLETVPIFLQHQKDLRLINLSNNKLTGAFPSWLLEQNPKLGVLLLQNNSFNMLQLPRLLLNHSLKVLDVSTNVFAGRVPNNIGMVLPNLRHLNLSNNDFQGNLPSSSGKMKMLQFLDLSCNYLSGILPRKFLMGCYSLRIFKISHNRFSGLVFSEPANLTSLSFFKADNNKFTAMAAGLRRSNGLLTLDMSNNYLQGVIPSWLGDLSFWYILVSDNLLEGTIPRTMFNKSTTITLLDLSRNKFSGNLPPCFNCKLMFLNDNEFSGEIPNTFLENVEVLDLRNNNLSGKIPISFASNIFIKDLLLKGNILTGHIPKDLCSLSSINILDLSNNKLNGSIPSCLNNVSFGRSLSNEYSEIFGLGLDNESGAYSGSLDLQPEFNPPYISDLKFIFEFASKSRYDSYNERSLVFMFGMDLSNNELSGDIPRELGDLQRIRALNLSHNSLSGLIPKSFSNLTDIESIDLSFNMLRGPIPQDLTKLDYMVVFNVSYNNLSGSIPSQGKFLTLDETNYIANPLLCGSAINRSCDDNRSSTNSRNGYEGTTTIDMEIFYWSLAATYGITWMSFIVFLCFDSPWRRAWFCLVDAFINFFKCVLIC